MDFRLKVFAILLLACFAGLFTYGQADTSKIAIIPFNINAYWFDYVEIPTPYSLSYTEILSTDSIINRCIIENNTGSKGSQSILPVGNHNFYKQLVATVKNNNEIIVWVNCFCRLEDGLNWKKEIYRVYDGGGDGCYFNVEINLTAKTYSKLYVNGF
jgi:hypothetical protein